MKGPLPVDRISKEHRSWNMSRICAKNTKPEIAVRSFLHKHGLRFRLHRSDLPGTPDIVLPGRRVAIFVHGCFWHRHPQCKYAYSPKTRKQFWKKKFAENVQRDRTAARQLRQQGWQVIMVWECENLDPGLLLHRLDGVCEVLPKRVGAKKQGVTS